MSVFANKYLFLLLIFIAYHRAVTETINPPFPCRNDQHCAEFVESSTFANCVNGFCTCTYNGELKPCSRRNSTHLNNKNADPPFPCDNDQHCAEFVESPTFANCENGFCRCKYNGEPKPCTRRNSTHINNKNAGGTFYQSCRADHECRLHKFCNTTINQCDCQKDYIWSNSKRTCIPKATALNFPCIEDKQCSAFLSNTTCINGQCNCIPGYHYVRDTCYKTIDIGKSCNRTEECAHVSDAVCTQNDVCDCPEATKISEDRSRCLPVAQEIRDNCEENVQCFTTFEHALCVDGLCMCQDGYHFEIEMRACFVNKKLNENCGNTFECHQSENRNESTVEKALVCVENVCVCAANYQSEEGKCVNEGSRFSFSIVLAFLATIASVAFSRQN